MSSATVQNVQEEDLGIAAIAFWSYKSFAIVVFEPATFAVEVLDDEHVAYRSNNVIMRALGNNFRPGEDFPVEHICTQCEFF